MTPVAEGLRGATKSDIMDAILETLSDRRARKAIIQTSVSAAICGIAYTACRITTRLLIHGEGTSGEEAMAAGMTNCIIFTTLAPLTVFTTFVAMRILDGDR